MDVRAACPLWCVCVCVSLWTADKACAVMKLSLIMLHPLTLLIDHSVKLISCFLQRFAANTSTTTHLYYSEDRAL